MLLNNWQIDEEIMSAKIIMECCQNHNGDKSILKDMIWAAAEAGADCVKIQSMLADNLSKRERFEEGITENGVLQAIKRPYQVEYDRLKPMDISDEMHYWFIEECLKAQVQPMTTVFSHGRVKFLSSLAWDEIKIASYDCASYPMLESIKNYFKHAYISTGSMYDEEIVNTAKVLNNFPFTFLHCVTIYPTPLNQVNLARIEWLNKFTPNVGFSDHSLVERDGIKASIAAILHGATCIERHFTILKPTESRDGPVSINPKQLKKLVEINKLQQKELRSYVEKEIPEYQTMIGSKNRRMSETELLNRDYYRGRFATKINGKDVYNWEKM